MSGKITTAVLQSAMALVGIGVLVSVLGVAYSSFVSYPTLEQEGKARIVWSLILGILLVVEALLGLLLKRLGRS